MFRLLLTMLLLPATAFALDPAENVLDANSYPTTQELYENCKSALALADKGNYRAFMRSECGLFMHGFGGGAFTWGIMHSKPLDEKNTDLKAMNLCNYEQIANQHNPSTRIILIAEGLADRFVRNYESRLLDSSDIADHNTQDAASERLRVSPPSVSFLYMQRSTCQ